MYTVILAMLSLQAIATQWRSWRNHIQLISHVYLLGIYLMGIREDKAMDKARKNSLLFLSAASARFFFLLVELFLQQ